MENKKNNISRRDFLKRLGMGTASALTLSAAGPLHSFAREKKIYQDATNNMTYRLSRNTGAKVSLLGFGMMRLPMTPDRKIDQEKVNEMVDYAMEHGVNYYDTSPHYGMHQSERATGNALKKYPRESFNLCTKMSSFLDQNGNDHDVAVAGYHKSFEECQVEYFDYYLIHGAGIGGMETSLKLAGQWHAGFPLGREEERQDPKPGLLLPWRLGSIQVPASAAR